MNLCASTSLLPSRPESLRTSWGSPLVSFIQSLPGHQKNGVIAMSMLQRGTVLGVIVEGMNVSVLFILFFTHKPWPLYNWVWLLTTNFRTIEEGIQRKWTRNSRIDFSSIFNMLSNLGLIGQLPTVPGGICRITFFPPAQISWTI